MPYAQTHRQTTFFDPNRRGEVEIFVKNIADFAVVLVSLRAKLLTLLVQPLELGVYEISNETQSQLG